MRSVRTRYVPGRGAATRYSPRSLVSDRATTTSAESSSATTVPDSGRLETSATTPRITCACATNGRQAASNAGYAHQRTRRERTTRVRASMKCVRIASRSAWREG